MGRRALVLEAHHTTHIEGTRLTLDQAEQLLAGNPVPEADPDDVQELLNYKKAFEFVSEYLEDGGPITEGLVREIHKRLVGILRRGADLSTCQGQGARRAGYSTGRAGQRASAFGPPSQSPRPHGSHSAL